MGFPWQTFWQILFRLKNMMDYVELKNSTMYCLTPSFKKLRLCFHQVEHFFSFNRNKTENFCFFRLSGLGDDHDTGSIITMTSDERVQIYVPSPLETTPYNTITRHVEQVNN